jgi:hypothetical protein
MNKLVLVLGIVASLFMVADANAFNRGASRSRLVVRNQHVRANVVVATPVVQTIVAAPAVQYVQQVQQVQAVQAVQVQHCVQGVQAVRVRVH